MSTLTCGCGTTAQCRLHSSHYVSMGYFVCNLCAAQGMGSHMCERAELIGKAIANEAYTKMIQAELARYKEAYGVLREATNETALQGITRPMEMGEGDDGDNHFRRIAFTCIRRAALAVDEAEGILNGN